MNFSHYISITSRCHVKCFKPPTMNERFYFLLILLVNRWGEIFLLIGSSDIYYVSPVPKGLFLFIFLKNCEFLLKLPLCFHQVALQCSKVCYTLSGSAMWVESSFQSLSAQVKHPVEAETPVIPYMHQLGSNPTPHPSFYFILLIYCPQGL